MALTRHVTIPRAFGFILWIQSLLAAVTICSAYYVFGPRSAAFILAVSATGLQLVLILYSNRTYPRPGTHRAVVVPPFLVSCAGLWSGSLYFLASNLGALIQTGTPGGSEAALQNLIWDSVGCATAGADVILSLVLLIAIASANLRPHQPSSSGPASPGFSSPRAISTPVYAVPPIAAHFLTQYRTPLPPKVMRSIGGPIGDSELEEERGHRARGGSLLSRPPWYPYDSSNRIDVIRRLCALQLTNGYWEFQPEVADLARTRGLEGGEPAGHMGMSTQASRTDTLKNSAASLVAFGGGSSLGPSADHGVAEMAMAAKVPASAGGGAAVPVKAETAIEEASQRKTATALVYSCLLELCGSVGAAQREGRLETALSPAEMISFRVVRCDLGWAIGALQRAEAWMRGRSCSTGSLT